MENTETETKSPGPTQDSCETPELQRINPIMKFFAYGHLPENLKAVSKPYSDMAEHLYGALPDSAEKSVALRKLLESKDAAVRAAL